ncbi:hypothetical protein, partial [Pyxidicoccus fallax]
YVHVPDDSRRRALREPESLVNGGRAMTLIEPIILFGGAVGAVVGAYIGATLGFASGLLWGIGGLVGGILLGGILGPIALVLLLLLLAIPMHGLHRLRERRAARRAN